MQLVVLGLNHKTVSVDIREQFAISEESARSGLRHLDEQEGIEEAVVLSTCNRTEIYAVLKTALLERRSTSSFWPFRETARRRRNISSILKEKPASAIF